MNLTSELSILLITSPSPSIPETHLIEYVIHSLDNHLPELLYCHIHIILDGFIVSEGNRTKKGKITPEFAEKYENYFKNIHKYIEINSSTHSYEVTKLPIHRGFAMVVKYGLEHCSTKYCLILQHDRVFMYDFHNISNMIELMELKQHIRYIGFPTSTSCHHNNILNSRYSLNCLNSIENVIELNHQLYLQPCIFW